MTTALPCPPEHWPAFSRRLDALLALPAGAHPAALAALPDDEAFLRPWLAAVLTGLPAAQSADFLSAPQLGGRPDIAEHQAGQRIGPYELLRELGRGGMGVVWLARRADGAYEREVALKLPHAHLLAGAVRERFSRERDILASLSHPNIARFYDAGLADDGQPYLALEAVHGQAITNWCRERALPLAGRLQLFDQVAAAVSHAHGRLVAHRDLKPANVLVTADGQVKLLDFGIAKLLQGDSGPGGAEPDSTALTRAQGVLATPQYAAPEQLVGGTVSVATDTYALGLMLFELLVDQPAWPGRRGPGAGTTDRPDEPPRPSRAAATPALRQALAGDLDAIVGQALQAAPEARYPSVAALREDLARHQRHEPIAARRLGGWRRLGKFVRRHRLPVALSAALGLALATGVAGVAWQAREAQAQARRAESVKDFLLGVFTASDPRLAGNRPQGQTPARELLDRAVARIDERFADDPELRIELLHTAADLYRELNEATRFAELQQRLLRLVTAQHGALHPLVLNAQVEAVEAAYRDGDMAGCRARLAEADTALRRAGEPDPLQRAHWWINQSLCLRDQPQAGAQRLAALRQAEALFARHAPGQRGQVTAALELASELTAQAQLPAAIATHQRALALARQLPERNEVELQTLASNLGIAQMQAGDLAAAALSLGEAAEIAERTTGADHPTAQLPRAAQARTLHLAGDRVAANRLFEALLPLLPPPERGTPDSHRIREDIGERLAAEGRAAEAVPLLRLAVAGHALSAQHEFAHRRALRHLGDALARSGQPAEARQVLDESLRQYETQDSASSQATAAVRERRARLLLDQGDLATAQAQFRQVIADAPTATWAHVALAQVGLARVALGQKDAAQALTHSADALATWQQLTGFRDVRMQAYLWRVRAAALAAGGDARGAQALRDQALAASQRTDAPTSATVTQPLALVM